MAIRGWEATRANMRDGVARAKLDPAAAGFPRGILGLVIALVWITADMVLEPRAQWVSMSLLVALMNGLAAFFIVLGFIAFRHIPRDMDRESAA